MGIYANNTFTPAVKVNQPIIPSGTLSIIGTGLYNVYSYSSISVNIEDLLEKRLTSVLSLPEYKDLSASKINPTAFAYQDISSIDMPAVTIVDKMALCRCQKLSSVNLPNCEYISDYAFTSCSSLTEINFPKCSYVGTGAFSQCRKLTTVSLPLVKSFNSFYHYAFANCYSLSSVYLPECEYFGGQCFYGCTNLSSISLPKCTFLGYNCFYSCSGLTSIYLPECTLLGTGAFSRCQNLTNVSLPKVSFMSSYAFQQCYNLLSLYLNVSSIPSLQNINVFSSTPISNYTTSTGGVYGSIFVPTSLYSSFISATNWANYSSRIVSMNF